MSISAEQRKEINALMETFVCDKDFKCVANNMKNLCRATYNKEKEELICLEEVTQCKFKLERDDQLLCNCKLRRLAVDIVEEK
jgi:hypothetical protein